MEPPKIAHVRGVAVWLTVAVQPSGVKAIIGILASIAIPKFANTKEKAYLTSMKSDLRNLVTAEEAYFKEGEVRCS